MTGREVDMEALGAEVRVLEADEVDRAEMLAVAELMESLRAEVAGLPPRSWSSKPVH